MIRLMLFFFLVALVAVSILAALVLVRLARGRPGNTALTREGALPPELPDPSADHRGFAVHLDVLYLFAAPACKDLTCFTGILTVPA